jgi:hypothetical protein
MRLRHGRADCRSQHHGRLDDGRHAGLEAHGAARKGGRARVSRRAVRARDRPLPAQERSRHSSSELRSAGRAAVPSQEIQRSDHGRRVRAGRAQRRVGDAGANHAANGNPAGRGRPGNRARRRRCGATITGRARWHTGRDDRRGDLGCYQQKQGKLHSSLQRAQPLQRMAVRLHAAGSRCRCGRDSRNRWCAGSRRTRPSWRSRWSWRSRGPRPSWRPRWSRTRRAGSFSDRPCRPRGAIQSTDTVWALRRSGTAISFDSPEAPDLRLCLQIRDPRASREMHGARRASAGGCRRHTRGW